MRKKMSANVWKKTKWTIFNLKFRILIWIVVFSLKLFFEPCFCVFYFVVNEKNRLVGFHLFYSSSICLQHRALCPISAATKRIIYTMMDQNALCPTIYWLFFTIYESFDFNDYYYWKYRSISMEVPDYAGLERTVTKNNRFFLFVKKNFWWT